MRTLCRSWNSFYLLVFDKVRGFYTKVVVNNPYIKLTSVMNAILPQSAYFT